MNCLFWLPVGCFTPLFSSVSDDYLALSFTEKIGACRQGLLHLSPKLPATVIHALFLCLPSRYQRMSLAPIKGQPLCALGPSQLTSPSSQRPWSLSAALLCWSACSPCVSVFCLKRKILSQPHKLSSPLPITLFLSQQTC